jgi:hypothetical protein
MERHYGGGDFCTYYQWGAVSCWCERSSCPDARRYWAAPLFEPKDLAFDDHAQSSIAPSEGVVAKQEPRGAVESRKDKAVKYCRRIVFDSPFTAPHIIDRHASYGQFLNRYVNVEEIVVTSKAIRETETPQAETACDPRPERWVKRFIVSADYMWAGRARRANSYHCPCPISMAYHRRAPRTSLLSEAKAHLASSSRSSRESAPFWRIR